MDRRRRSLSVAVLAALASAVAGASLAFACTGPGFGTPSAPAPAAEPGPPEAGPVAPPASATTPAGATGTSPSASGGNTTSGAVEVRASPVRREQGGNGAAGRAGAPAPAVPAVRPGAFAARERGATAGVTSRGGQPVFVSSTAPKGKPAAAPKARKEARAGAPSASERSAVADPWSGFDRGAASRGLNALGSSPVHSGGGSTVAMAMVGLGLVGLLGTLLAGARARRRRAPARSGATAASDSRETRS